MAEADWASLVEEWPPRGSAPRAVLSRPFVRAYDITPGRKPVRMVRCGDSRSTQPAAAARHIDNALTAYMTAMYGNCPGTPYINGGNQSLALNGSPGMASSRADGGALDAAYATYTPPGVLGIAWTSAHTGESVMYSPQNKSGNPRQFFVGSKLTDRATARMSLRHLLFSHDPAQANSGQLAWQLWRNDLVAPAFFTLGTQVGGATTAQSLDGTGIYVREELSSDAAHVFSTSLTQTLIVKGSHATNKCNWLGSSFENHANPQGVICESYGASGYKYNSWTGSHANCGEYFRVMQPDVFIFWFGANDAAQNITAAQFKIAAAAFIAMMRAVCPNTPIWLVGDYYRGGLTGPQLAELDLYPARLLELAKATYACGFLNLRKKTEACGWNATKQVSVAAAVPWALLGVYVAGNIVSLPDVGNDLTYWRCLTNHTAAATDKPGTEQTNASLYWEPVTNWLSSDLVHPSVRGAELVANIFADTFTAGAGSIAQRGWRAR